jgi:hypothetical protein
LANPSLEDIFGAGASQTINTITIVKADLPMTALSANNGEQIFAAIAKKAADKLTPATFGTNPDQSISIVSGYNQTVYRTINGNPVEHLQVPLTINFTKPQLSPGITPDDY